MNSPEQTPESRPARERRVGTFTFGAVLVICGALMLVSMFFPSLDLTLALQLSPLILVCLGVEVLLASRSGGKIRYDWVGMVLCFVLVTAALVFFGIAWCLVYHVRAVWWTRWRPPWCSRSPTAILTPCGGWRDSPTSG